MPRQRSVKRDLAYDIWIKSKKKKLLKDIAAELEVGETQIRKWKNQDQWEAKSNITKKTGRKGGQIGNKNAVGNKGGAPKGNKNRFIHGIYQDITMDSLDEEELFLISKMNYSTEQLLQEQIALLSIRERRFLKLMQDLKASATEDNTILLNSIEREFTSSGNNALFLTEITENETSIIQVILRLESELTRIQGCKTKCLDSLSNIRLHLQKEQLDIHKSTIVDIWIDSVLNQPL